jgi:putative ABC transport system ATP-binding protein
VTSSNEVVLRLDRVSKAYWRGKERVHALRQVSLAVAVGELVAVMGPSGSGKSTLLNVAGGLVPASDGAVVVCGRALQACSAAGLAQLRRRTVGYVFQELNLVPSLTAAENVALPLELDGRRPGAARHAAVEALGASGLAGIAGLFPDELSGGQQQQVAIARALVGDRRLLLADEPTGALDTTTGDAVLATLRGRCDAGVAAVVVTHQPRHAAWADRVVFLRDGALVDEAQADLWAPAGRGQPGGGPSGRPGAQQQGGGSGGGYAKAAGPVGG